MEGYNLIPTVNQHGLFVDERVSGYCTWYAGARLVRVDGIRPSGQANCTTLYWPLFIAMQHESLLKLLSTRSSLHVRSPSALSRPR